jgi:8-oxo-dGTP pyrophosphatase MutT (NUDIX family)
MAKMTNELIHISDRLSTYSSKDLAGGPGEDLTPAATLMPLFYKDGELNVLFTKRAQNLKVHRGEISFPGGRLDYTDSSLLACALRETHEEIGVQPEQVHIIGRLDETPVITYYRITPFVGVIPYPFEFVLSEAEIDSLVIIPLSHFLNPACHRLGINDWAGYKVPIHFYDVLGEVVWGATGRIMTTFLKVCYDYVPPKYAEFLTRYKDPLVKR